MRINRLTLIVSIIILIISVISIYLLSNILPNMLQQGSINTKPDDTSKENTQKRIVIITDDLSLQSKYNSVMDLKSMFADYKNIVIEIYDSQGNTNKQSFYLTNALETKCDAIVVYPIVLDFIIDDLEKLHKKDIPVVAVGVNSIDPYYISIGFSLETTGKMQAQALYASLAASKISVFSQSPNTEDASILFSGFITELKNRPDIEIERVVYTSGLTEKTLLSKINTAMSSQAIVIQDKLLLHFIIDTLDKKEYEGIITGVTQDIDMLKFLLCDKNKLLIYQNPQLLNRHVFNTLLDSLKQPQNSQFIEVHQTILNSFNIKEYLNE